MIKLSPKPALTGLAALGNLQPLEFPRSDTKLHIFTIPIPPPSHCITITIGSLDLKPRSPICFSKRIGCMMSPSILRPLPLIELHVEYTEMQAFGTRQHWQIAYMYHWLYVTCYLSVLLGVSSRWRTARRKKIRGLRKVRPLARPAFYRVKNKHFADFFSG